MPKTLLIADDSATIRKIVELTFRNTDVRVESVASGREAMDRWTNGRHDVVLADVFMPDVSGYEICRSIKGSSHPVPVLLLAGTFEPFDADLARECGADAHLIKPFEADALRTQVRDALERHATRRTSLAQSGAQRIEADGAIDDLVQEIDGSPEIPPFDTREPDGDREAEPSGGFEDAPEAAWSEPPDAGYDAAQGDAASREAGPREFADDASAAATIEPVREPDGDESREEAAPESAAPVDRVDPVDPVNPVNPVNPMIPTVDVEATTAPDPGATATAAEGDASPEPADPALVEAVVQAVLARLSEDVVRELARDMVPDIAARIVRERIREIEEHG